jgi:hypothetical protein
MALRLAERAWEISDNSDIPVLQDRKLWLSGKYVIAAIDLE